MSDLKPLREALARLSGFSKPHASAEGVIETITKMMRPVPFKGSVAELRNTHHALLGYQCRQPEIDALAKSNAELLEALRLSLPYIESDSRRGYDGTNGNGIRAEAKRRLEVIQQAITNAERKDGV